MVLIEMFHKTKLVENQPRAEVSAAQKLIWQGNDRIRTIAAAFSPSSHHRPSWLPPLSLGSPPSWPLPQVPPSSPQLHPPFCRQLGQVHPSLVSPPSSLPPQVLPSSP